MRVISQLCALFLILKRTLGKAIWSTESYLEHNHIRAEPFNTWHLHDSLQQLMNKMNIMMGQNMVLEAIWSTESYLEHNHNHAEPFNTWHLHDSLQQLMNKMYEWQDVEI